ncbi:MAG: cellulase family glycosylhydrolase [Verrucomicrobiota bacterium]
MQHNFSTSGRLVVSTFSFLRKFAVLAVMGATLASSSAAPLTFLRTQGQDIVNESGEKIMLRGVGLGNWMLPEGYMWKFGNNGDRPRKIEKLVSDLIGPENAAKFWQEFRQNYITEADIQRIAELGYNSVRPALNARLFLTEGENPVYLDEGFQLLDNLVKWSRAHGIYVIIDMHGAPGGQTGQNIDDSPRDLPELFMETKYQDRLAGLWRKIAERYKDEPTVAGYDLLNEPLPERTGAAREHKHKLEPLYKRLTQIIREVDSKHMIVLEGADWSNDWTVFTKPFDSNLVYQFHYYCWDNPTTLKGIDGFLNYQKKFNAPVWVGETGERDSTIYWGTTELFEANNIGWSFWPWKKMDTSNTPYSIKRPQGWDAIVAYCNDGGAKPAPEKAQRAFDELLRNIRVANCDFFPDVVNAMLRRAPVRVEAENFGHEGAGKSFSVRDTTQRSKFYRHTEPVRVTAEGGNRRRSGQHINLAENEWTAYQVRSDGAQDFAVTLHIKPGTAAVELECTVGSQTKEVKATSSDWSDLNVGSFAFAAGTNQIKVRVKRGEANLDWLDIGLAQTQQSAQLKSTTAAQ